MSPRTGAGIAKAGETLISTSHVITTTVQALASARSADRKGRMLLLSDAEQEILVELRKVAKRPPLLLIADNLHWWDARSPGAARPAPESPHAGRLPVLG